jgi:Spy/CpxP family protein refolding chaperone
LVADRLSVWARNKERTMKKTTKMNGGLAVALAVAVGLAANPLQAQRGGGVRGQGQGPNMGTSLEVLLEQRELLELTGDQVNELEVLKATMDADVTPLVENVKVLREQIRAGDVDRNEGARQLQALQGELMIASAPLRGRVQEILTVDQHRVLQQEMRSDRPGRGRGGSGFQGSRSGSRGRAGAAQGWGGRSGSRSEFRGSRGGYGGQRGNHQSGFRRGGGNYLPEGGVPNPAG